MEHTRTSLSFGAIREADLDLLLMQHLACDDEFRSWFANAAGVESPNANWTYKRDVHRTGEGTGQTDLMLESVDPASAHRYAMLIEDKIDAALSDRTRDGRTQLARYQAHAQTMRRNGYTDVRTVLVAPRAYANPGFDAHVALEDVAAALATSAEPAPMRRFFLRFLDAALGRHATGWQREAHAGVSTLWQQYGQIAKDQYADLQMRSRDSAPGDSYTVSFSCLQRIDGLGACRIDHVMERGNVDILVPGLGHLVDQLESKLKPTLPPGAKLRAAGKSLGVNIKVPEITRLDTQPDRSERIRAALNSVRLLKLWFEKYGPALAQPDR